jgi:hypothetical protein
MSISLVIAINVLADIALIAGLAYVMLHPTRLKPHVASVSDAQTAIGDSPASPRRQPADRATGAQTARGRTPVAQRTGARTTATANANR